MFEGSEHYGTLQNNGGGLTEKKLYAILRITQNQKSPKSKGLRRCYNDRSLLI